MAGTLYGPWQGSTPHARVELDYDVSYNADHTNAFVHTNGCLGTDSSLYDSTNVWECWGTLGSDTGANTVYNHGSGGGRTPFRYNIDGWVGSGGADIGLRVRNLEGPGATIENVFHVDVGALAPYTDGNYTSKNVTSNSFSTTGISGNGNGGALVDIQAQINTSQSESGATTKQAGGWADISFNGLTRYTTYYFRVRIANNTYGWGPWGPWKAVTTLKSAPATPIGYSATAITQTSAQTTGVDVPDNGGQALSDIRAQISKTQSEADATIVTRGSWGDIAFNDLDPGTPYYFRLQAYNGVGWSNYGAWVSFETLPGVLVKYGGVWQNAIPYVKVGGIWKQATRYVKANGIWR